MSAWPDELDFRPITQWPGTLTETRVPAPFRSGLADTLPLLKRELRELRAKDVLLQIALRAGMFRVDGRPRADARPEHPGIILSMRDSKVGPLSYPCDRFDDWIDNLRAITLSLEALRKVDRYGVTKTGEQYRGFAAIEAGPSSGFARGADAERWLRGEFQPVGETLSLGRLVQRAKRYTHPDMGHSGATPERWARVQAAEAALRADGYV